MPGPLSHLTVLDLSRVLAGPWCTQLLADLGADVIKIEKPGGGDDTRRWGPPFLKDADGRDTAESAYYLGCNRGKQSVAIDLTSSDGQRIVRDLCKQADIVVDNFRVGALTRYGLDYAALAAINARLVYCSITGFGQTGPYAERAGYDFIIQGIGGFMSVTGERDGQFARFCEVAGMSAWLDDLRFSRNSERVRHRDFVVPSIANVLRSRTQRDWLASLEPAGVPCGPINRIGQVFADPQVAARGMRIDMRHPLAGSVPQVGNPLKFSATPVAYTRTPPLLGEHTRGVLHERLGLSDAALVDLAARGVIEMRK